MWKIPVVKSEWIYDSIEAGYCLPEKNYILESDNQTSTPTDHRRIQSKKGNLSEIDISMIPNQNNSTKCVNDTEINSRTNTTMTTTQFNLTVQNNQSAIRQSSINSNNHAQPPPQSQSANNFTEILRDLNAIGKTKITLFDGIGIYCENFDAQINEKLKKICNQGGAIRFDEYNSDVTHVITNQVNEKHCKAYIELNPE